MNTRYLNLLSRATVGALLLAPATALAVPHAASVASPPLVVGGLMVGLVLLAAFVFLLLRTFRNMQAARQPDLVEIARQEALKARDEWARKPNVAILQDLLHAMLASETAEETALYHSALCELSGRYFKSHETVEWELWLRNEAKSVVTAAQHQEHAPAGEFLRVS